jgi:aryl carrier-like protein
MANLVLILLLVSAGLGVVFSMMIVHEVSKRGVKVSFVWLRLYIIKYIHQYQQLTRKDTGKVGPLYYPCIVSYIMALVFLIVYLIVR